MRAGLRELVSIVTVRVAVASSMTRAHDRRGVSPAGRHPVFAGNHSLPFSQTDVEHTVVVRVDPRLRLPGCVGGCDANGGGERA